VFENRVLKNVLDLMGRKQQETGENCVMRSFMIIRGSKPVGRDGQDMWYVWGRREMNKCMVLVRKPEGKT
jgi:hypothetical protein